MRSFAFTRGFFVFTGSLLFTLAAPGCVPNVETGGGADGGSGGGENTTSVAGSGGDDCGDTESTSISVGVGVGGYGTSAVSGVGGANPTSGSVGQGGSGGACGTPQPVGPLVYCGGAVSAGSGMGNSCANFACDQDGNTWDQTCDDTGLCTCTFNNVEICACQLADPSGVCNGGGCCPFPWLP